MFQKPEGWHTGFVSLWDLPKDKTYVDLKEPLKSEFIKILMETLKTKSNISRSIDESYDDIRNFFNRNQTKSLEFLGKLMELLNSKNIDNFNHELIEKSVSTLQAKNGKKIFNPIFPLNFNTLEGAALISSVFHDGGITKGTLCPFYRNYRPGKIQYIKNCFERTVGKLDFSMQNNNTKIVFPNIFGIILINGLGLESGAKTISNPNFPEFIFDAKEKIKTSFLKQAFDDEGSVTLGKSKSRQITFYQSVDMTKISPQLRERIKRHDIQRFSPNILKDIKKLLLSLQIKTNKPCIDEEYVAKDGKISHIWKITISHKNNIKRFYEKIGFGIPAKQRILNTAVKSYIATRPYPEMQKDF